MKYIPDFFIIILLLFKILVGQPAQIEKRAYKVLKTNPKALKLDGKPNDLIWEKTCCGDSFIQIEPNEAENPLEKTEFKICYDDKNLYVIVFAYDKEPENIMSLISRRDDVGRSDLVCIILDTYFDQRTAFEFTVNPVGVKFDGVDLPCVMKEDGMSGMISTVIPGKVGKLRLVVSII